MYSKILSKCKSLVNYKQLNYSLNLIQRHYLSNKSKITTHYSVVPRDADNRWKDINMERVVDETDVIVISISIQLI
jgi:hypothetical protein